MAKEYDYELEGLQKVQQNLNEEIDKIKNKTADGINKSALVVERGSKKRTPVDTGNLKNAHYTESMQTSKGPGAEIGNTAEYAIHVHERLELNHPVGEAKFLEHSLRENSEEILNILRAETKVR